MSREKSLLPLLSVKNCWHALRRMERQQPLPSLRLLPHQNQAVCIQIAREESGAILTHSLHSARGYNLQLVHPAAAGHGMAVHITAIKTAREKREGRSARRQERKKEPKKEERTCDLLHHKTSFIILVLRAVFSFVVVIGLIYF